MAGEMVGKVARLMPERLNLGRRYNTTMATPMGRWQRDELPNPNGLRSVMGFFLPTWQRGLVWAESQMISFIESAWRGIDLGTYTYNEAELGSPFDNLLIDGQQRMFALQCYLTDEFPVFGWRWSEVTVVDRRAWEMSVVFGSYVTRTDDEDYLQNYYDLMNFGGTPHLESERARSSAG